MIGVIERLERSPVPSPGRLVVLDLLHGRPHVQPPRGPSDWRRLDSERQRRGRPGLYAIEIREVWAWHNGARLSGSEVTVRLSNDSIDPHYWKDQPLTLVLWDDLRISGCISEDGTQFVRTGAADSPRSAACEHSPAPMPHHGVKRRPRVS